MSQDNLSRYVLEHMGELVITFDERGLIGYGNTIAEEKLEFAHQLPGTHISEIFPNEFKETEDGFETQIVFGTDVAQNLMAYRLNRTCFAVAVKFSDLNEDFEYVCIMKDITNRNFLEKRIKQVEQDAEDALKVKSEFVANVTLLKFVCLNLTLPYIQQQQ